MRQSDVTGKPTETFERWFLIRFALQYVVMVTSVYLAGLHIRSSINLNWLVKLLTRVLNV